MHQHFDVIDLKTIMIGFMSIGTIEWANTFTAIYPAVTKAIQLIIGLLTIVYLIVKIISVRNLNKK